MGKEGTEWKEWNKWKGWKRAHKRVARPLPLPWERGAPTQFTGHGVSHFVRQYEELAERYRVPDEQRAQSMYRYCAWDVARYCEQSTEHFCYDWDSVREWILYAYEDLDEDSDAFAGLVECADGHSDASDKEFGEADYDLNTSASASSNGGGDTFTRQQIDDWYKGQQQQMNDLKSVLRLEQTALQQELEGLQKHLRSVQTDSRARNVTEGSKNETLVDDKVGKRVRHVERDPGHALGATPERYDSPLPVVVRLASCQDNPETCYNDKRKWMGSRVALGAAPQRSVVVGLASRRDDPETLTCHADADWAPRRDPHRETDTNATDGNQDAGVNVDAVKTDPDVCRNGGGEIIVAVGETGGETVAGEDTCRPRRDTRKEEDKDADLAGPDAELCQKERGGTVDDSVETVSETFAARLERVSDPVDEIDSGSQIRCARVKSTLHRVDTALAQFSLWMGAENVMRAPDLLVVPSRGLAGPNLGKRTPFHPNES
ncbi:hypothetical protein HK104_006713, partial [Borealophlyctis nickersoniae]